MRDEKGYGFIIDWWELAGLLLPKYALSGHGDALETSAIMAFLPELAKIDEAKNWSAKRLTRNVEVRSWQKVKFQKGTITTWLKTEDGSDAGNFGSLEGASAEQGEEVISAVTKFIVDFIEELKGMI